MREKRYAYRHKDSKEPLSDYSAKAPATSGLYDHIGYKLWNDADYRAKSPKDRKKAVKEIAKAEYTLVTYVLVEESALASLQEDSDWLGYLEAAGVDNWQGYYFARELQREAEGEDEE